MSLDPVLERKIDSLIANTAAVMACREPNLKYWKLRAQTLRGEQQVWRSRLPKTTKNILGCIHFPLLKDMLRAAEHVDQTFLHVSENYFPVTDAIWAGGAGIPDETGRLAHGKEAKGMCPDISTLRFHCKQINAQTLAKLRVGEHAQ